MKNLVEISAKAPGEKSLENFLKVFLKTFLAESLQELLLASLERIFGKS